MLSKNLMVTSLQHIMHIAQLMHAVILDIKLYVATFNVLYLHVGCLGNNGFPVIANSMHFLQKIMTQSTDLDPYSWPTV